MSRAVMEWYALYGVVKHGILITRVWRLYVVISAISVLCIIHQHSVLACSQSCWAYALSIQINGLCEDRPAWKPHTSFIALAASDQQSLLYRGTGHL